MSKFKKTFELTYPNAAGIDIGASSHFVAVPADRNERARLKVRFKFKRLDASYSSIDPICYWLE